MRVANFADLVTDQPRPGSAGKIAVTMYASTSEKRTLHHEGHEGCTKDTEATVRLIRHRVPPRGHCGFAPTRDCARSAQKNHGGTENTEVPGRGSSVTSVPPWRICLAP